MKHLLLIIILMYCQFTHAQIVKEEGAFIENFNTKTPKFFRYGSTGNKADFKKAFGVQSLTEPKTTILLFKIDPADSAGPGRGPEIISNNFTHFGTYSARLKIPDVVKKQPNAGAVVGYFTYHVDSIPGLSEIDFEWLIADPEIIYIGTWTGHESALKRIGRTINLAKGIIYTTEFKAGYNGVSEPLTGLQNQPASLAAISNYNAASQFYTYGFDWYPDRLRWWILHPVSGKKIILWDYQGSQTGIPQNHSHYRMNFWHTNNWPVQTNSNSIEKPTQPYQLEVDWMKYKPFDK